MNKEIILCELKLEDVKQYPDIYDLGLESGIDIVKELYRSHEKSKFYVPTLGANKILMERFIIQNREMNLIELKQITGYSKEQIKQILFNRKR